MENIELLIENELLKGIENTYKGIDMDYFVCYLILRAKYNCPPYSTAVDCIKKDLAITDFIYDNTPINITSHFEINSLLNIWNNWVAETEYKYLRNTSAFMFSKCDTLVKYIDDVNIIILNTVKANTKRKLLSSTKYKKEYLKELNKYFNVTDIVPYKLEHIPQNIIKETEIKTFENPIDILQEEDIEDYLCKNLNKIETGLKFISRQVIIPNGRLDILARDTKNNTVIIEVKRKADKRLIWQCLYYPEMLPNIYRREGIRMITIVPDYPEYLMMALSKIDCECYAFQIDASSEGNIEDLRLRKIR